MFTKVSKVPSLRWASLCFMVLQLGRLFCVVWLLNEVPNLIAIIRALILRCSGGLWPIDS